MASFDVVVLADLDGRDGFRLDGSNNGDSLGRAVAAAGDVNGDGIGDLVVAAPLAGSRYRADAGLTYVVFGREGGGFPAALDVADLDPRDGFRIDGRRDSGRAVSAAGDVNGDGVGDLLIGTPGFSPAAGRGVGAAYVVYGRQGGGFGESLDLDDLDGANGFRLEGPASDAAGFSGNAGYGVGAAGDVNGDGVDDIVIGAPFSTPLGRPSDGEAGAAFVVFGRVGGGFPARAELTDLDGTDGFRLDGVDNFDLAGVSVAGAGDVNGDGIADLLVGAVNADPEGRTRAGSTYVVFGRGGGGFPARLDLAALDGTDGFRLDGAAPGDRSGGSVAAAGDVNGDGVGDLLVGADGADPGGRDYAGAAYVVFGREAGGFDPTLDLRDLDGTDGFRLEGFNYLDSIGQDVSAAGDFNGDGVGDILIGSIRAGDSAGQSLPPGAAYLIFGRVGSGFDAALDLGALDGLDGIRLQGAPWEYAWTGFAASAAGDLNADGFDDVVVGAPQTDPGWVDDAGSAYVVFGRASPTQLTASDDRTVTARGGPVALDPLANDVDPGGAIVGGPRLLAAPADGVVLVGADAAMLYIPGRGFEGIDAFDYAIEDADDNRATATVTVEVGDGDYETARGSGGADTLNVRGGPHRLLGFGGDDSVLGTTGADLLFGGTGRDLLRGGNGDDVLRGGGGRDELKGGGSTDLFVLESRGRDVVLDFNAAAGDAVAVAIDALLLPDGRLDGDRVEAVDAGSALLLRADLDGDGAFEALLARLVGGAGLALGDVLLNEIA